MSKFSIGDEVVALVQKIGGAYEPNCSINVGDKTTVCAIHQSENGDEIYCEPYCGFVFKPGELKLAKSKPQAYPPFYGWQCSCGAELTEKQKFCSECGVEQDWDAVKPPKREPKIAQAFTPDDLEMLYQSEYGEDAVEEDQGDEVLNFIQWLRESTLIRIEVKKE
jgi:hypothetical protein